MAKMQYYRKAREDDKNHDLSVLSTIKRVVSFTGKSILCTAWNTTL